LRIWRYHLCACEFGVTTTIIIITFFIFIVVVVATTLPNAHTGAQRELRSGEEPDLCFNRAQAH
jgi:hypothetical protein